MPRSRSLPAVGAALVLMFAVSLHAQWTALSVQDSCNRAQRIVIGTLQNLRPFTQGEGDETIDGKDADIAVDVVLFGPVAEAPLPMRWSNRRLEKCLRVDHEGRAGEKYIWFLTEGEDGVWHADHPNLARLLVERPDVETAIAARITLDRETLEAATYVRFGIYASGAPNPGAPAVVEDPPVVRSCKRLAEGGLAARPAAQALLKHASPIARAWGCRLAHILDDHRLIRDIVPLLADAATVPVKDPDYGDSITVSELVRLTLAGFAGKSGRPFPLDEAKTWAEAEIARQGR